MTGSRCVISQLRLPTLTGSSFQSFQFHTIITYSVSREWVRTLSPSLDTAPSVSICRPLGSNTQQYAGMRSNAHKSKCPGSSYQVRTHGVVLLSSITPYPRLRTPEYVLVSGKFNTRSLLASRNVIKRRLPAHCTRTHTARQNVLLLLRSR